jgi:hypothetical protein
MAQPSLTSYLTANVPVVVDAALRVTPVSRTLSSPCLRPVQSLDFAVAWSPDFASSASCGTSRVIGRSRRRCSLPFRTSGDAFEALAVAQLCCYPCFTFVSNYTADLSHLPELLSQEILSGGRSSGSALNITQAALHSDRFKAAL